MGKIGFDKIERSLDYTGYLWLSNEVKPRYKTEELKELFKSKLKSNDEPVFIVEGQLFHQEGDQSFSLSIKYADGEYLIYKNEIASELLKLENGKEFIRKDEKGKVIQVVRRKDCLSNRMDERWLKFLQFWEAKPDENCNKMPVLTLTNNIFIGFKK